MKVVFLFGSRIWLQERQALLPVVLVLGVVEVEVREGKEKEALNREHGDVVEESEDEGRSVIAPAILSRVSRKEDSTKHKTNKH